MGYPNNKELINSSDGLTSIPAAVVNNTGRIPGDSIAITGASNNRPGAGRGAAIASLCSKLLALVLSCAVGMFPCGGGAAINGPLHNTDGAGQLATITTSLT
ncbi:hypothetical protein, partial [Verminephrobacter aporrectodeae]|uniref:hypothetical protein n=1 Tax=Verminephrobacter aporrectodeae TaxID=1110389 RepID=UPI000237779D